MLDLRRSGVVRVVVAHPLLADGALALAMTAIGVLLGRETAPESWRPFDGQAYLLTACICLPLTWRRRAPTLVMLVGCAFWTWYVAAGYWPVVNAYGMLVAFYTVATCRPVWETLTGVCLGAAVWIYGGLVTPGSSMASVLVQSVAIPLVTWKMGHSAKQLAVSNCRLAATAGELRRSQREEALRAVGDERVRIARELHDVVAHHMSVVSVQAGLARYVLSTDPPTARSALDAVLETSRQALDELGRMLGLLRLRTEPGQDAAAPGDLDPMPGLDALPDLLARFRAAGLPVTLSHAGTPRPLPPGLALSVYRIVQESLTNTLKHAGATAAEVTLAYEADGLTVTVEDDGRATTPHRTARPGHGLTGMRERAKLYEGTLVAGPRKPHGYAVRLTVPRPVPSRAPHPAETT